MKIAEIRLLSEEELKTKLLDSRQELMNLKFQVLTGQQTDTSQLKKNRRLIAKYETVLREHELNKTQEGEK